MVKVEYGLSISIHFGLTVANSKGQLMAKLSWLGHCKCVSPNFVFIFVLIECVNSSIPLLY